MNILIVAATPFEVAPLIQWLEKEHTQTGPLRYRYNQSEVSVLITGVGMPLTAYALGKVLPGGKFDLALNAGIAGAFKRNWAIGDVVQVVSERFGDLGVEEADGRFIDVHELNLIEPGQYPFQGGHLLNNAAGAFDFLPKAQGLSVNRVHGSASSIEQAMAAFDADVESMEGAAFFYACLMEQVPFLEIRSISNYVAPRNRDNWNIPLAIDQLNAVVVEVLEVLCQPV
ncbi:MAG: futalosine hydrolase [Saprospiraceae bacterium]|nr:futalosine hydrolase [Saprospiraceae bacterium]MDZ4703479.1 futalosine hydrolase [Saprospiraceae bacterium]